MPLLAAKLAMNASAREQRGRSGGQPRGRSSACGRGAGVALQILGPLLHCPGLSTVNVLTAPPLLGQHLPHSVLSKGLPTVRLVVHGNMSLVSPLLLSCPLHMGCLWTEMCSTEPFTTCCPC